MGRKPLGTEYTHTDVNLRKDLVAYATEWHERYSMRDYPSKFQTSFSHIVGIALMKYANKCFEHVLNNPKVYADYPKTLEAVVNALPNGLSNPQVSVEFKETYAKCRPKPA